MRRVSRGRTIATHPTVRKRFLKKIENSLEENENLEEESIELIVNKNISNTEHKYISIVGEEAIKKLVAELEKEAEICIDTETTGIGAEDFLCQIAYKIYPGQNGGAGASR